MLILSLPLTDFIIIIRCAVNNYQQLCLTKQQLHKLRLFLGCSCQIESRHIDLWPGNNSYQWILQICCLVRNWDICWRWKCTWQVRFIASYTLSNFEIRCDVASSRTHILVRNHKICMSSLGRKNIICAFGPWTWIQNKTSDESS